MLSANFSPKNSFAHNFVIRHELQKSENLSVHVETQYEGFKTSASEFVMKTEKLCIIGTFICIFICAQTHFSCSEGSKDNTTSLAALYSIFIRLEN